MKKKALIVGINYEGSGNDLRGCINDANNIEALLKTKGFTEIKMVLEKEATTKGIISGLNWLVTDTAPGDVIVFHYSGHGSQLPSKVEPDGFEEILCPIDLNWTTRVITDDTLRNIFNTVPNGVNTTLILDCCHSGTALDQDESVIVVDKDIVAPSLNKEEGESRYLPPPAKIEKKLAKRELVDWTTSRDVNKTALLIAGCRADQTSADAFIDGTYQGAATYAILKFAKENPDIDYKTLVAKMVDFMRANRYTQRPQLDGSASLHTEVFAEPFGRADEIAMLPPAPQTAPVAAQSEPSESSDNGKIIAIIAVVIILFLFVTL
jgi:hypothetical protein